MGLVEALGVDVGGAKKSLGSSRVWPAEVIIIITGALTFCAPTVCLT